jgi:hypothetical protein
MGRDLNYTLVCLLALEAKLTAVSRRWNKRRFAKVRGAEKPLHPYIFESSSFLVLLAATAAW